MSESPDQEDLPAPGVGSRLFCGWGFLWAALVTIPSSIAQVSTHPFNPTARNFKKWASRWARGIFAGVGVRVEVTEAEPLDPEGAYIFVANHQNALDILALAAGLPYPFGFVAKADLAKVPFLGFAIRNSASVFIDRSDPRSMVESMRQAGERIRSGNSVLIFPEGTRTWSARLDPYMKGAFLLAVEAGVPLVPVTIVDAYRLMDERRYTLRSGTIHVRVGRPIPMEGRARKDIPEIMEAVRRQMKEALAG